jgi:diadenosine tetraphosphate (Ap4A) HIT family hydrolase
VWADASWRVIRADDRNFPAFYRVISRSHIAELTDLDRVGRTRCLELVSAVERALRRQLAPTSINLAAFGNVVPHLHWHVIARFDWDSHFPEPIWGQPQRENSPSHLNRLETLLPDLDAAVGREAETTWPSPSGPSIQR